MKPIMDDNEPVIYVDETSFNLWDTKAMTWMSNKQSFGVPIPAHRNNGLTAYMAIGNCLTVPYVHLIRGSTNQQCFLEFLRLLTEHIDRSKWPEDMKPHLVHDGHTAHRTAEVVNLMRLHFRPLRIPRYSCRFNSIEHLFGFIKNGYRKINLDKCIRNNKNQSE